MYFWYQVTLAFFAFVPLRLDFPLFLINKWLKLKQTRLTFCERRTPDEVLIVRKRGQPLNERWYQSSLAPQYLKKYLNSNKPIRYISRCILNWKKSLGTQNTYPNTRVDRHPRNRTRYSSVNKPESAERRKTLGQTLLLLTKKQKLWTWYRKEDDSWRGSRGYRLKESEKSTIREERRRGRSVDLASGCCGLCCTMCQWQNGNF